MPDEEKLVSHYRLKTLLRRDGFGAVYLSEDTRDQKEHLLRIIELDQQTLARITGRVRTRSQRDHPLVEQIRQRVKRISELKHAHILPVIEFGEEHIQETNAIIFYMASPYAKESLLSYWSEHYNDAELITLEVIADLVFQAGEALFSVHKRGLVHQYVRLSSFMLRSSTRGRRHLHLLLTDFWFADISPAILEEGQIAQDLSTYLAPEQLAGRAVPASDQYALAVLAYELLLGHRLSQVDRSLGLYERSLRQRSPQVSAQDLERARRIDLVLARALAENAGARFHNIEEFAYTLRGVMRGEALDLADEETFKLLAVPSTGIEGRKGDEGIALAAAGALAAGEIVEEITEKRSGGDSTAEMLAAAEVEEETHPDSRHSLHKTVLTSAGMEAVELATTGERLEETTITREGAQAGGIAEEETVTTIAEEQTQPSAVAAGATGFAAGLAAGEALQREADIAEEQTQIIEGGALAAAGEAMALEQETDIAEETTQIIGDTFAAGAAGLAAGGVLAGGTETGEVMQEGGAGLAGAGVAAGGALAGSAEASEATQESGAALAGGGAGVAAGSAGIGVLSAAGGFAGGGVAAGGVGTVAGGRRRHGGRRWLSAALLALVAFLIIGALLFALIQFTGQSAATVTLTLQSHTIQNSYLVTAVTGTVSQGEVQASMLTQTVSQSKSGQASGFFSGTQASGFITFRNTSTGCGCPVVIPAGTAFTGASGVTVVTSVAASVASMCSVTVPAHALIVGPGGDIPAGDIHAAFSPHISATNATAFSGGQFGQSNAIVQQSDINGLASTLQKQVLQSALAGIQAQVTGNQRLLGSPACKTKTTANHAAGDFASSVTVTVSVTCAAEAYDYAEAIKIVQHEVQIQASSYFSSQFALVGAVQATLTRSLLTDARAGTILLVFNGVGKWVYNFSHGLQQSLVHVIAGKTVADARSILAGQAGVSAVSIKVSGRDQSTLPTDNSKITIVLKA
ncbi:MAG TPA: hypothetical protein VKV19_02830 [Ktedonobacteraceae bacterium]|nr:hypothetical protein [Ktedonobacteraceae bacterium]